MTFILGAGQPRTGTFTLKNALQELGFGPCYHMFGLLEEHPEDIKHFIDARDKGTADWKTLLANYKSGVDFPLSLYYKSVLEQYPDAKIILTTRDAEAWYTSISKTVFVASQPTPAKIFKTILRSFSDPSIKKRMPVLQFAGRMIKEFYGPDLTNKDAVVAKFNQWNVSVIASLPAEQVLVFDVKDGWEPLCKFLNVPVPATPFPNLNSTAEFTEHTKNM